MTSRQPFLHDQLVVLRAPSQVWSARSLSPTPVPYPAACRPQAWSAAAAVAVWAALSGSA